MAENKKPLTERIDEYILSPNMLHLEGARLLLEARDELLKLNRPKGPAHSCDIPGCAVCDPCYGL